MSDLRSQRTFSLHTARAARADALLDRVLRQESLGASGAGTRERRKVQTQAQELLAQEGTEESANGHKAGP